MDFLESLVSRNLTRLIELIKSNGLNSVNSARFNGNGLVHVAAGSADSRLTVLVIEANLNLEERNKDDMTAVHVAVARGNVETLRLLMQAGADSNATYGRSDWAPLHQAVRSQAGRATQLEVVRVLLQSNANASQPDADGNTPLHLAVEAEADKRLIAHLADAVNNDLSAQNRRHLTPLEFAAINGNREAIRQLVKRGAVPQIRLLDQAGYAAYVEVFLEKTIRKLTTDTIDTLLLHPDFQALTNYIMTYKLHHPNRRLARDSSSAMISNLINSRYRGLATFKSLLHNNVNTQFVHYLSDDAEAKLAWTKLVVTYILYRESVSLLKALVEDRLLFFLTDGVIQAQLYDLYKGKFNRYLPDLISNGFVATDSASKAQVEKSLHKWLKKRSRIYISNFVFLNSKVLPNIAKQMFRHPVFSLITWATVSGRHHLLPYLFLAEDTDYIPLALFNMALLHHLMQTKKSIGTLFSQDAEHSKLELEILIHYLASRVWHQDKSYQKIDSAMFLLQKLPAYGQATMVDMAMTARSLKFIQFTGSVTAMRLLWYRGLNWMPTGKRLLLILSALGLWFMLMIPLVVPRLDAIIVPNQNPNAIQWQAVAVLRYLRIGVLPMLAFFNLIIGTFLAGVYTKNAIDNFKSSAAKFDERHEGQFGSLLITGAPGQHWRLRQVGSVPAAATLAVVEFLRTPAVKYTSFFVAYIVFLMLGMWIGMLNFRYVLTDSEIVYWILFFSLLVETAHQYIRAALFQNCFYRVSKFWVVVSLLSYTLGLVAFSTRMTYHTATLNTAAISEAAEVADNIFFLVRYLFVLSNALLFLQIWRFLSSRPCVGLLIRMIEKLVKRYLPQFLLLMSLVLLRGAFIFGSLLYPQGYATLAYNNTLVKLPLPVYLLRVFVHSFYSVMGEFLSEFLSGFDCQPNSQSLCPATHLSYFLVTVFHMSGYVFYTTLLLLGLLVSLVTIIVDEHNKNHTAHWQLSRYGFMQEVNYFSLLYPPFNLLYILGEWVALALKPKWIAKLYDLNDGFYSQSCVINNLLSQSYVMERDRDKMLSGIEARREHRSKLQIEPSSGTQQDFCIW